MKPPSQRQLRVGEEVRHALALIFERGDFRDPALASAHVTVTEVRASPDLRHMTVFVTPLGGGDAAPLLAALKRATPFLRGQVARAVRTKYTPDLVFRADMSIEAAARVEALFHSPAVQRDLDRGSDASRREGGKDD
ncbi:30S ribosome-binding factor RbfA [Elioraea sp.]|jgi:ribosome-binding factor A|uniref:30S ribosome-binding factor RbfA n=1 Tax=Elioraea sp. TaxID=2185103 RepID=UPI0021DCDD42|nr:30S ribosome-binding factor RbfA [Elioraea sp.]GIX09344.1 MAG: ribosome-binding factor A [Elioraea sp.]